MIAVLAIMAMFVFTFVGFAGMTVPALLELISGGVAGPEGEVVARTNWGNITRNDVAVQQQQRSIANRFLLLAQVQSGNTFGANQNFFGPPTEEDVVNAILIRRRADELGMRLSDDAVGKFIDNVTRDPQSGELRFTSTMFDDICKSLRIPGSDLFDILRAELMVSEMVRVVGGSSVVGGGVAMMTPAELWDKYQKLNTTITLEVAAVPVADFTGKVPEPSDDELKDYFEQYKEKLPDPSSPDPGFRQPRRVQVEYLMAAFDRFLEGTEVSEEEIDEYYERNKQRYRIFGDSPSESDDAGEGKQTEDEKTDTPADAESSGSEPDSQRPSDSEPKPQGKPTDPAPETNEEDKPEQAQGPAKDVPEKSPAASDEKNEGDASPEESEDADSGNQDSVEEQTESSAENPEEIRPEQPAEEGPASGEKTEATDDSPAGEKTAEAPADGVKPPEEAAAETKNETTADAKPEDAADEADDSTTDAPAEQSEEEPEPRYRPLDDLLALEIRDELRREKALQRIEEVFENKVRYSQLDDFNRDLGDWIDLKEEQKEDPEVEVPNEPERPDFEAIAERYGLEYGLTPLVSRDEAAKLEGIGTASDFRKTSGPGTSFVDDVFSDSPMFESRVVRDEQSNGYLYWKVDEKPEHVPGFDEVREQVLGRWNLKEAREHASSRALELAEKARDAGKPLEEALAGDPAVVVQTTPAFSWLSRPPALGPNTFAEPPPRPSEVAFIDRPGEEFFQTAFALDEGEITTVSNAPKTIWHVVRVVSREEAPRDQFLRERFFGQVIFGMPLPSAYDYLAGQARQEIMQKWLAELQESAGLEWVRPPDQPDQDEDAVAQRG